MPKGYLAAEFLEATGSQRLKLGVTQPGTAEYDLQFTEFATDSQCMGFDYLYSKWGVLTNTQYRLGAKSNTLPEYANGRHKVTFAVIPSETKITLKINKGAVYTYEDARIDSVGEWCLWQATDDSATNCKARIWRFSLKSLNEDLILSLLPAINAKGQACFYDTVQKKEFVNTALYVGLTCKQALQLAKLPSGGGTLKISLPWDAQLDKKVDAALSEAKAKGWTIVVQYQEPNTTSAVYNKYATCKTYEDVVAVNADYKKDLTSEGEWVYPMPEMTRFDNKPNSDWWLGFFYNSPIKKIKAVFPKVTYCHAFLSGTTNLVEADLEFPAATRVSALYRQRHTLKKLRIIAPLATSADGCFYWSRVQNPDWYVYYPKATNLSGMFSECIYHEEIKGEFGAVATNLDTAFYNCSKLRVFPTNYPKASTAKSMFAGCQIPGEAAIAVLNSFPAYTSGTHEVTMGIHKDYETNADVAAAVADAEAKGWDVSVQFNGTATTQTASTFGMRRKPIYAKLGAMEIPDGETKQVLDWGHYVTNWEANGYQEFASVEEAKEYFNIED